MIGLPPGSKRTATLFPSTALFRADAGAGALFVPFLLDRGCIGAICDASPLPVNILRGKGGPTHKELAALGVARISHGHQPWAAAMAWLAAQAAQVKIGRAHV